MLELAERGLPIVEFPQSNARMGPASERLHAAIVERRLSHLDDPALNAHVRQVIARDTPRSRRLDKLRKCGDTATEVDHIRPVIDDGTDHPSTLRSLCHGCHAGR